MDCKNKETCEKIYNACLEEEEKIKSNQSFFHDHAMIWSVYKNIINKICNVKIEDEKYYVVYSIDDEIYYVSLVPERFLKEHIVEAMLEDNESEELFESQRKELDKIEKLINEGIGSKSCITITIKGNHKAHIVSAS
ncbi:MAG: hypothetical protein ABIM30_00530 [candidate division WOR-3 bacterium]